MTKPFTMRAHAAGKTNAVRVLDGLGIKYELREYKVDPHDLSAETVAAKIDLPPEQVFKTQRLSGIRVRANLPGRLLESQKQKWNGTWTLCRRSGV